jgi:acyl carrier protein phosphodiesterase
MNYLAHAYLNGLRNDEVLMGNMMGDFVKGSNYKLFSHNIQEGIMLHRHIDLFTDQHQAVASAKQLFRANHGLFSGILTDILFDYFLANDKEKFSSHHDLKVFTNHVYSVINHHETLMDEKMLHMTFYMKKYDWLYNYRLTEGITQSFDGLFKRIPRMGDVEKGKKTFLENLDDLKQCYTWLMSDLKKEFFDKNKSYLN